MKKIIGIIIIIIVSALIFVMSFKLTSKDDDRKVLDNNKDVITTTSNLESKLEDGITLNYQSSVRIEKSDKVYYFDPYKIENNLNDANYIFLTHSHYDHFSLDDIKKVMNEQTKFIVTNDLEEQVYDLGVSKELVTVVTALKNYKVDDVTFDTIPAYNTTSTYHKQSYNWVGYNVKIDNVTYYIVGDSDLTDDMKTVKCDVMFVPVGGTYTMDYKDAIKITNIIKPKVAIPYHYDEVGSKNDADSFVKGVDKNIKGVILRK